MTTTPSHEGPETTDRDAILLMLSYVEAECRRLGAMDAARHAALAAALMPETALTGGADAGGRSSSPQRLSRRSRLH